jgi:glycosyltransferase involved in cell wall biosynthesis
MRIGIVTTWFPAGGGYVSKAYKSILEKKHEVFIYARGGQMMKGNPDWDLPNVTWAPTHYNGIKINHFLNWAKENKIDILFFNEQRYWKPVIAAKKAGYCIGSYIDYYTQSTVSAFEIYDFLICNTQRHYSVFSWHKNASHVPWGTHVDVYKPSRSQPNNIPVFIISSGWQSKYMGDRRGSLLALQAFQNVKGNCKLYIYSQVPFEQCLPVWQDLIKADERITLKVGTFEPFPYTEGDVYLYPSRLDGIGLTLPEAISSGLAAITTNNGPMNEFVIDDYNGFLIEVEKYLGRSDGYYWAESLCSTDSLTRLMQKYVDDPELLRIHKVNSRDFALKNLNWEANASNLSEIFEKAKENRNNNLDENLRKQAENLDKIMAPTDYYKIVSSLYIAIRHLFSK